MFINMNIAVLLSLTALFASSFAHRFVCYYGSWSVYRHGPGKFTVEDIDPTLCTHLMYAFVGLNYDGTVKIIDPYNDIGDPWKEGAYKKLQRLRRINPNMKIMCAIGGWNEGSTTYSQVINDRLKRKVFVQSIVDFALTHKFDGFDLDWEYPNQRGGVPSDREAFSEFIAELKGQFEPRGLVLSAAVSANALICPDSYNCKDLTRYLDFITVMSYDLHGSWEKVTGHHTAMYPHPMDPETDLHLNVKAALEYWVSCTGEPSKINIGLASYGRTYTLYDASNHGIGAPAIGPGPAGNYVPEGGFLGFHEICKEQTAGLWTKYYVPEQDVIYAVKGKVWVGYDDTETIIKKLELAKSLNLGGASIWSIETDDFRGQCGMGKYPLLTVANNILKLPSHKPNSTTQYPHPPTSTNPTTVRTTATTPSIPPETTSKPPKTTTPPNSDNDYNSRCQHCGHSFKHPKDPRSFFICTYSGVGTELNAVLFTCPTSLVFDDTLKVCVFPTA